MNFLIVWLAVKGKEDVVDEVGWWRAIETVNVCGSSREEFCGGRRPVEGSFIERKRRQVNYDSSEAVRFESAGMRSRTRSMPPSSMETNPVPLFPAKILCT